MRSRENREAFKQHVLSWAGKLEVPVRSLSLRPMRNKWASCSSAGNLNFNPELLEMKPALVDYVIVHELLHLRIPNHGKLWKSLMRVHVGDYEALELELRKKSQKGTSVG